MQLGENISVYCLFYLNFEFVWMCSYEHSKRSKNGIRDKQKLQWWPTFLHFLRIWCISWQYRFWSFNIPKGNFILNFFSLTYITGRWQKAIILDFQFLNHIIFLNGVQFSTACHCSNSQNSIIFFWLSRFLAKKISKFVSLP